MLTHFVQEMAPLETTRLFHPPPPIVLRSKPDCAPKKGVKHQNTIDEHSLPVCPFTGTTRHSLERQSNFSTIPIQNFWKNCYPIDFMKIFGNILRKISEFRDICLIREILNLIW